ncbi:MAG: DEAD/DEAH box helicase family protein [Bacteroidales bacterium]|nr:DEAD/DEAH box helicase family protein [Bacteroidales bacterium]MCF8343819.1 DEAD/DEAH box helicase family protein [Bacteroidales bacterium]MCF8350083.1 DEAD/DEAH box helicase family protein [Bacteroidales bacterium]MCF8374973.1 DEAD/DEAH box helicase family protein [Bacteroidales bacterium]MCF8402127.1 DEAD/DEAH box helicase family protein [Bacteroidales bacterium]
MKKHTEKTFESYIEETIVNQSGWQQGTVGEWDQKNALFPARVIDFLQTTQPRTYEKMQKLHGTELNEKLIQTLIKELNLKGILHILRHGFKFYGKTFDMAYFKPAHGLNPEIIKLYNQNQLTVTRQVPCHPGDGSTIDLLFSINGLPVATCEIKNPVTGQNWRHAVKQYKTDRDWRAPLFQFKKRAVVHFAVDPDEVHMTTRLNGDKTRFLPFNRGSHPGEIQCGKGNPQHPSGHRTAYFWEEVLHLDSFLDVIGHFMYILTEEEKIDDGKGGFKKITKETVIFPRYHQLDSVRKLVSAAREENVGHNYLIQHSAGSGKTNSISWLSHRLASLHTAKDKKVFDCVVVITDRKVLDKQLQDAIYQIEHAQGVVKPIDEDSKQLAEALVDGTQIVITTLQKFPFVLKGLLRVAGADSIEDPDKESIKQATEWQEEIAKRNYAVIVDEAHSSQTGETARELKEILGAGTGNESEEVETDWEDRLNQVMESRGTQKNLSFFAFTATPKGKTLELFGKNKQAFHIYSMRQAIEEGFILDVLQNYTTFKTFYKLVKSIADDPEHGKKKAIKAFAKFMSLHPVNIQQKTEIIVEHFRTQVAQRLRGKAKAMLVTHSRLQAVKYMLAFERYIKKNNYHNVSPMVAFSGSLTNPDDGIEYTEPKMNIDPVTGKNISESQLPEKFATNDFNILLVANKYQTGFDQPLLHTMYVDKRLDGVQAVQTLSRLNRSYPGKELPIVLDFINEHEDIYIAFKPYYDTTLLAEESDPALLEELKFELDKFQVYHWSEVEAFAQVFYKSIEKQTQADHARMNKHVQPAKDRYRLLEEDDKKLFRDKLSAFVRYYAFISQLLPFSDPVMEMLYSYGRFLLPYLGYEKDDEIINPDDEIKLQFYRTEHMATRSIALEDGEIFNVKSPSDVGTGKATDEKKPLSEIIEVLNERFGTNFTEEDRLFFEQIKEKAVANEKIIQTATANSLEKFQLGIKKIIEAIMIQRMSDNDEIVTRYMDDHEFQDTIFPVLTREIYEKIVERE